MPLLLGVGLVLAFGALAWGLLMVPPDRLMGQTVRILFIHVPCAWLGMAGWSTIAVSSLVELVWRHPLAAIAARAAAVPGAVFTALCLITGSIWARPTWGTWWVWDGRLTSFLILLFLYFGYIALAGAAQRDAAAGGGASRVTAIFGHGRRDQHPDHQPLGGLVEQPAPARLDHAGQVGDRPGLPLALLMAALGFSCIFGGVVLARMRTLLAISRPRPACAARPWPDPAAFERKTPPCTNDSINGITWQRLHHRGGGYAAAGGLDAVVHAAGRARRDAVRNKRREQMSAIKAKHQRLVLLVIALAALIGAGLLAAWALSKQASYFYVPSDLVAHPPEQGRAVRLGGMVQRGSIKTMPDGVTITFVVGDGKAPCRCALGSRPTSSSKDRAWSPKGAWKDHVRGRQPSGQA
jgi:heme exporter protein C